MTNPPSIRYNIKQSIFAHYEMRGRIFKKEEIYRKFEEDSAAGRREGIADFCDWGTCYINDRTKSLDLQGIRTCLFYFIKIYGRKYGERWDIVD